MGSLLTSVRTHIINFKKSVKLICAASHKYFIMYSAVMVVSTVLPYIPLWIMRRLLNDLTAYHLTESDDLLPGIIIMTVLYCGSFLLSITFGTVKKLITYKYNDEIDYFFDNLLIDKIAKTDLSYFDSSSRSDQMQNAANNIRNTTQHIVFAVFGMMQAVAQLIMSATMIGTLGMGSVFVIILLCIPPIILHKTSKAKNYEFNKSHNIDQRHISYYKGLFFDDARQEIRLYGVSEFFIEKYQYRWERYSNTKKRLNLADFGRGAISSLFSNGVEIFTYIVAIAKLASHLIGVGDVTYYVSLATKFRLNTMGVMNKVNDYIQDSTQLDDILAFIESEPETEKGGSLLPGAEPRIEFCGVSFRYPFAEEYVLRDCSFSIEPGQSIGLVGVNGAGKSTIVKLLLRFYDPTEGRILIDGIDAREYDLSALRKLFSAMFQDFCSYAMTVRENIAIADIAALNDEARLNDACEKSRASQLTADFGNGLDENLTKYFDENGKELSGGGWQRIALARAFFRRSPVVLLDEPSASLDPLAEYEIFSRFSELSEGRTTVLISHRLSNIVRCDRILVLDKGRIAEQGSHDELLHMNGRYAQLFNLQASKYTV